MHHGAAKEVALRSLRELGYHDDLFEDNWSPRDLVPSENGRVTIPTVAFWGRPFDQFRSAISIVDRNGLPDYEIAHEVAMKAWTHVAVCGDLDMSLWLFGADDVRMAASGIATEAISRAFQDNEASLNRMSVARQKMRLRQYALHEIDPNGESFADWAIKPSAEQTSQALSQLVSSILRAGEHPGLMKSEPRARREPLIRWVFRVLTMRVGIDRAWEVTQGLAREDVSDMVQRAARYPHPMDYRPFDISLSEIERLTESILEALRLYDFSTIDPILVVRAFSAPSLKELRAGLDLFPTPRTIAWDIISSIPIQTDHQVCDPTVGTGTFLVTAGLNIWASAGPDEDIASLLRGTLVGGDQSGLAADLAKMALDLVFGWHSTDWQIDSQTYEATIRSLDRTREWVILGNLPWSGRGRAENESSKILRAYLDALGQRPSGWLGTITPKSIWTKRDRFGDAIRSHLKDDFRLEQAWELNWETIKGGRSQALASVLARSDPSKSITVWKREDTEGVFRTIGYLKGAADVRPDPGFRAPDAVYLAERLDHLGRLGSIFDVRHGLQPKSARGLSHYEAMRSGDIRFVRNRRDLESMSEFLSGVWLPESLINDDSAVLDLFKWPQREYRRAYRKVPQLVLTRDIYEGLHRLKVDLIDEPALFSDAFLICIPRSDGISRSVMSGVAIVLGSTFGRVWLHLNALAGRHLSIVSVAQFPLPSERELMGLADYPTVRTSQLLFERELQISRTFGLSLREALVFLGVGTMLGLGPAVPSSLIPNEDAQQTIDAISHELSAFLRPGLDALTSDQRERVRQLWGASLRADVEERRLVLQGHAAQVSIEKSAITGNVNQ